MMRILRTNPDNWLALFARVAIAVTIFPHGARMLLGWFGGSGFTATMDSFTQHNGFPWIIALLVILIESIGSLFLFCGFLARITALGMAVNFVGVVYTEIWGNGFFMNWGGVAGAGEGLEYFILLFGLIIISLIAGGGKASVDALFQKGSKPF